MPSSTYLIPTPTELSRRSLRSLKTKEINAIEDRGQIWDLKISMQIQLATQNLNLNRNKKVVAFLIAGSVVLLQHPQRLKKRQV